MRATIITLSLTLMLVALPYLAPNYATAQPVVDAVNAPVVDTTAPSSTDDVNSTGAADAAQTPAEGCRASCTREFELCGDEGAASDQTMMGRPSAGFSKNHCSATLADCLQKCRGL